MKTVLLFSDKVSKLIFLSQFYSCRIKRFVSILFKGKRDLKQTSFGYYQNWQFSKSFLFIGFEFENAIWFKIGNYKSCDFSKQIVLDLEFVNADSMLFEVFGFFQKQVYEIKISKEAQVNTESFSAKIEKNDSFELINPVVKLHSDLRLLIPACTTTPFSVSFNSPIINLKHKPFKIQEYL